MANRTIAPGHSMARDPALSTAHPAPTPAPVTTRRPAARARRGRRVAAALGFVAGVMMAGMSALPRPGIPRAQWEIVDGGTGYGVVAERYQASPLHRWLMGDGYRDVWAAPVRAPIVDLRGFAGGLTPVERGGGRQTRGLRLRGADGGEYRFRSLDKDQGKALSSLPRLLMGPFRQDQVSALHPGAALVASGLQDAAGVLHATPRLGVMPTRPWLPEEFAGDFGALPGTLQAHPGRGFRGAERVVDTDALWNQLRRRPHDRVNVQAYLRARLMDVYMGDWDRHEGQLRWARFVRGDTGSWVIIPRDRDYAFSDYGGVIPGLARRVDSKIVRFDTAYRDLRGLLVKARELDGRLLCGVSAAEWDAAAAELANVLDDAAISAAIHRMPREWIARSARLEATLRARRDRLPHAARRFRQHLHDGGCPARR
ncbi:MAG TPA: hypothetical protein VHG93_12860 [Longimicrobium sp.]|nr:hypothetical protein [Longimicrobium sp.]